MTQSLRFDVTGLSCAGCAGRAERALAAVPNVIDASVNFATAQAVVHGDASPEALRDALAAAGYPAGEGRIRLAVDGMTCASCAGRVERALMAEPGVLSAHVNLASETAELRVLRGAVAPDRMAAVVTETGYAARVAGDRTAPAGPTAEDRLWRDTLVAAALTLPVFVTEMGGHLVPALHHWIAATLGQTLFWGLQWLLITAVLIGPGRRFYRIGLPLLAKGVPDMNSLVALGTLAAWGYSTVALVLPDLLPDGTRAVYFEAAGVIVTLILLGRWLEARAKGRTGAAIRALMDLRPDTALVERDGDLSERPVSEVRTGEVLHARSGARIAVDGTVLSGRAFVDESMITGEPVPVEKTEGAPVVAGTVNGAGLLRYEATAVGRDTVLSRIVAMVEEAQGAKLPIQALADRVVRWFVPAVLAIAALTVAVWLAVGPNPTFALVAGVSVLIIACPCAMGLATPTSIMVGTGRAAELGVLFRKGDALQKLDEVRMVAFDKTGTLTVGKPEVVEVVTVAGVLAPDMLTHAASAEAGSDHPIAKAILRQAPDAPAPDSVETLPGFGLRAVVHGATVLVGAPRLMMREGIDTTPLADALARFEAHGWTPVLVATDGMLAGAIAVADRVKPGAVEAVAALKARGVGVAMITGDNAATAQAIAAELGIDTVAADILPEGKRDTVRRLAQSHGAVAFCGDGINDAPALAAADVGIAIGTGTDVAIESADVVLSSGDLSGVVTAHHLSHRVMRNIRQNLVWAFGYNVALIPVAAGVLYPVSGVMLSPMLAAGAMALSSVFVVSNALRLRRVAAPGVARDDGKALATLHQEARA